MSILVSDLVRDLKLTADAVKEAEKHRKEAETRLIDGLALIGTPLNVGSFVVIGDTMIKRQYAMLAVEISSVTNVPAETVVIVSEPSLNPHSDLP